MHNGNHALVWKMADRFPDLSESDFNLKLNNKTIIELGVIMELSFSLINRHTVKPVLSGHRWDPH